MRPYFEIWCNIKQEMENLMQTKLNFKIIVKYGLENEI